MIDTTVLIDFWRQQGRSVVWGQIEQLVGDRVMLLPWIAEAEFLFGAMYKRVDPEIVRAFLAPFVPLPVEHSHVRMVAQVAAELEWIGMRIGWSDLWIAAAALQRRAPVITRNGGHFSRVPGLSVLSYELPR
ncbi:MAG: type II toxin-antitoxin system VapC family toxin [Planctomycetes bacterium]|nr:type II toxin-antitoxin system VapC family toxin [Planctomycetota bacterium]